MSSKPNKQNSAIISTFIEIKQQVELADGASKTEPTQPDIPGSLAMLDIDDRIAKRRQERLKYNTESSKKKSKCRCFC